MKGITIEKICVTVVLVAWYVLMPQTGYRSGCCDDAPMEHLLAMVSHAGVWHLACNLFVLWIMTRRLYLIPSMVIALVMSFVPSFGIIFPLDGVTMGFSGVLFAIVGIKWGVYCRHEDGRWPSDPLYRKRKPYREFATKVLPFALVGILIPNINWCIHTYCLLAGLVYGRFQR